jgi:translocation and assembly module TamB
VVLDNGQPIDRAEARKQRQLVQRGREPTRAAPTTRHIRVVIEAPRNLWIEAADAHLELGLDEGFVLAVNDETRVFGTVLVRRGRVQLMSKRFDVDTTSAVRFTGPLDRPTLAVKATYQARTEGLTVVVALSGPLDRLQFQLSSPDHATLGDTELLTLLATGHLPDEHTGGTTTTPESQAASLLGGVLASQVQKTLSRRLPLDVLVIEPGQGLSAPRLEAGTYLTDSIYVAYVGRTAADPFGRENRNEIQLEYQLSRRWSFQGVYGDARKGSADLLWTKSY